MTSESSTSGLVVDDDFGYLLTGKASMVGNWRPMNGRRRLMGKNSITARTFRRRFLGLANMVKVPGRDLEFYMMTWKNAECSVLNGFYFAGKKP